MINLIIYTAFGFPFDFSSRPSRVLTCGQHLNSLEASAVFYGELTDPGEPPLRMVIFRKLPSGKGNF